jgi:hypothetical protein
MAGQQILSDELASVFGGQGNGKMGAYPLDLWERRGLFHIPSVARNPKS